jgi:type I restriction enzyme M protein
MPPWERSPSDRLARGCGAVAKFEQIPLGDAKAPAQTGPARGQAPGKGNGRSRGDGAANGESADLERTLWLAADKMRGNLESAEYKHVVLGLIFLKYISDAFDETRAATLVK